MDILNKTNRFSCGFSLFPLIPTLVAKIPEFPTFFKRKEIISYGTTHERPWRNQNRILPGIDVGGG